jgi:drug/metabolite transporter (DMT)-like permease
MAPRHAALLAALAAIWGGSYLLIKYALEDLEAPVIVWARTAIASLVLLVALGSQARGALADLRARPRSAVLLAVFAVAAPFTLITLGEHTVPSGLTAVLIAPSSLFVALFAPFLDPAERIDRRQGAGMFMGLVGVALVVGVESVHSTGQLLGALAMLAAAAFYGLSGFVVKGRYGGLTAMQTSFVSISTSSLLTLPAAVATMPHSLPGLRAAAAVLCLGAVGTALAFVIFYKLMGEVGPARASLVAYLAPGVALLYGATLLGERITLAAVAGLVLILAGVAVASRRAAQPLRKRWTAARFFAGSTSTADSPSGS